MDLFFYTTNFDITKNGVYEGLSVYLKSLKPTYTLLDYKYIQPALSVSVKVPFESHQMNKKNLGDYCMMVDGDAQEDQVYFFYFVTNIKWRGAETVELTLALDTLNTF